MPILNYTTKVDVHTTLGEIQQQLVKHGARKIMQDWDDAGRITLPANVDAVHKVLTQQKVKCDLAQAERVAWRIIKDWVEAQMAILESEMVKMEQIFLPYMINNQGQTFFEAYRDKQLRLEEPL